MTTPAVEYRNITMAFGDKVAVQSIKLSIARGQFVVLLGPSGGGKTTLLNILGGFLTPTDGQVFINGEDVTQAPPAKRPTTTVFQDYALFPHMTVAANIGFGLKMRARPQNEIARRVQKALDLVGLGDMGQRRIHQLSGGQRQRIAMARALVVEPAVLLLDEPLGALDMKLRRQLQEELKEIQKRTGTTFVHVTHDQEEAMAIADQIVVMNNGTIEDSGSPEDIYLKPKTKFCANFMGENNVIDATVSRDSTGVLCAQTALGSFAFRRDDVPTGPLCISLRPEHIYLRQEPDSFRIGQATVQEFSFFGTHHQARVRFDPPGYDMRVRFPQNTIPQTGQQVELFAKAQDLVFLNS